MLRSLPIWATKQNRSSKIYPRGLKASMRILEEFLPSQKVSMPCPKTNRYTLKWILTKSHNTCKDLICITPNCCLSLLATCILGNISTRSVSEGWMLSNHQYFQCTDPCWEIYKTWEGMAHFWSGYSTVAAWLSKSDMVCCLCYFSIFKILFFKYRRKILPFSSRKHP